jgi:hypothetical protein
MVELPQHAKTQSKFLATSSGPMRQSDMGLQSCCGQASHPPEAHLSQCMVQGAKPLHWDKEGHGVHLSWIMMLQLPWQAVGVVPAGRWCGVLAQLLSGRRRVLCNFVCIFVGVGLCHIHRFIVKMPTTKLTGFST